MHAPEQVHGVTLRAATFDDVAAIAAIERVAFSDPWPASAFRDLLTQKYARITAAFDAGGRVRGYLVLLHVLDEGEVANIAVAPDARRQGVAAQLLDDAIDAAGALGLTALFLEVRISNEPARALYASRGFEPVGRRRAYYRDPLEDALILRWESPDATTPDASAHEAR